MRVILALRTAGGFGTGDAAPPERVGIIEYPFCVQGDGNLGVRNSTAISNARPLFPVEICDASQIPSTAVSLIFRSGIPPGPNAGQGGRDE